MALIQRDFRKDKPKPVKLRKCTAHKISTPFERREDEVYKDVSNFGFGFGPYGPSG